MAHKLRIFIEIAVFMALFFCARTAAAEGSGDYTVLSVTSNGYQKVSVFNKQDKTTQIVAEGMALNPESCFLCVPRSEAVVVSPKGRRSDFPVFIHGPVAGPLKELLVQDGHLKRPYVRSLVGVQEGEVAVRSFQIGGEKIQSPEFLVKAYDKEKGKVEPNVVAVDPCGLFLPATEEGLDLQKLSLAGTMRKREGENASGGGNGPGGGNGSSDEGGNGPGDGNAGSGGGGAGDSGILSGPPPEGEPEGGGGGDSGGGGDLGGGEPGGGDSGGGDLGGEPDGGGGGDYAGGGGGGGDAAPGGDSGGYTPDPPAPDPPAPDPPAPDPPAADPPSY